MNKAPLPEKLVDAVKVEDLASYTDFTRDTEMKSTILPYWIRRAAQRREIFFHKGWIHDSTGGLTGWLALGDDGRIHVMNFK